MNEPRSPTPARGFKPTPARQHDDLPPGGDAEVVAEETEVQLDGDTWTVRVMGSQGGGWPGSGAILLLGFWRGSAPSDAPELESLTVGRSLAALSSGALAEAFSRASTPRATDRKRPFFSDVGQGRGR